MLSYYIKNLYSYLDSLSLLQEFSLIQIFIYIIISITAFQIIFIFFSNEIINSLKLDERYPSLAYYINLRSKFQRYYLLWNTLIIILVCLLAIILSLFTFIYTS